MSVFGKIKDAIFGRHAEAAENPAGGQSGVNTSSGGAPAQPSTPASAPAAPQAAPSGASPEPQSSPAQPTAAPGAPAQQPASAGTAPQSKPAASASVDVERIMDQAVKAHGQKLDWRHSIVDMMKALDLDSSLSERKELAEELGYHGDANDSAEMNVWLHKALLKKLAENGGKVPADLTD
ncbi:DUF3597 domain-containing protein [Aureimonas leprariae]|uniref:DUF3597 family protein n=1 Tax=Plantimonas leprariae TaxID=2615207 RepID=A0A7V7PT51_9HYPH|nr:DUF3597 domain-containing protein [Aureimonas leprariae]KAB0682768.1 DUF3597 family protein [Aureimonas leprariae]